MIYFLFSLYGKYGYAVNTNTEEFIDNVIIPKKAYLVPNLFQIMTTVVLSLIMSGYDFAVGPEDIYSSLSKESVLLWLYNW